MGRSRVWLILVWVVGWGCATTAGARTGAGAQVEPGERGEQERLDVDVRYTVDVSGADDRAVEVTASVPRPDASLTYFEIERQWAGLTDIPSLISEVRATDGRGRALEVRRPKPHRWQVRHERGATVHFSYRVSGERPEGQRSATSLMFTPQIEPGRVFLIGHVALVEPMHFQPGQPVRAKIRWKDTDGGWKTVHSHAAASEGPIEVRAYLLRHILLYAGTDLRVLRREVKGNEVYVAMSGDWSFRDAAFADVTARILRAQRNFFGDHSQDFYLVSLLPIDLSGTPFAGSQLTSGTGLHQSLATFLDPEAPLSSTKRQDATRLLGHEIFHNWNGGALLRPPEDKAEEPSIYWFTEGFTEHFTREILFEAGILTVEEYLNDLNEQLVDYQTNPRRGVTNRAMVTDYWSSRWARKLAYDRGSLIALHLNRAIRRHSDGQQGLGDMMRYLRNAEQPRGMHPNDWLFEVVGEYTDVAYAGTFRGIVEEGVELAVTDDLLGRCFQVERSKKAVPEYGFAVQESLTAGRAKGIERGGPAAKAGLKSGERVRAMQKYRSDEGIEMHLEVGAKERSREVVIEARVETMEVARFRQVDGCRPGK